MKILICKQLPDLKLTTSLKTINLFQLICLNSNQTGLEVFDRNNAESILAFGSSGFITFRLCGLQWRRFQRFFRSFQSLYWLGLQVFGTLLVLLPPWLGSFHRDLFSAYNIIFVLLDVKIRGAAVLCHKLWPVIETSVMSEKQWLKLLNNFTVCL